jgi:hypothetical protein
MDFTRLGDFTIHTVATNHTIGIPHVPDSLAATVLGDFLIHTVSLLITDSLRNWFSPHCVILNHRLTPHAALPAFLYRCRLPVV